MIAPRCVARSTSCMIAALGTSAGIASAQGVFRPLGTTPGLRNAHAYRLSDDATVIVGTGNGIEPVNIVGVRWEEGGIELVPLLPGTFQGSAEDVSGDGQVIVGCIFPSPTSGSQRPFRWSPGSAPVELTMAASHESARALAISRDGSTIVGSSTDTDPVTGYTAAARWSATGLELFEPPFPWMQAVAHGVSADGSVMVGGLSGAVAGDGDVAFRRQASAAAFEILPALAPGRDAYAVAISVDARVIVGSAQGTGDNSYRAVRWVDAGGPQNLGVLSGYLQSDAFGVSADGRIVVGGCNNPANRALLYSDLTGLVDLQAFLSARGVDLLGWTLELCFDVSADGSVLVGMGRSPQGVAGAWRVDVPDLLCQTNCDTSHTPPVLNVADLTCFLRRFAAGDLYANCDQSTTPPVLNVADFTCFLQQFAVGCP